MLQAPLLTRRLEQYEIKQARKELELAAWRNHGQENFGNVYVQRSVK